MHNQVLRRGVEVAELKGQLEAVKRSAAVQGKSEVQSLKSKILDLEVELQRLKDNAILEKKARTAPRTTQAFVL